ncbi:Glycerophosphoryl diester phosphodiesterase family, partial [Rhizoctonia solani]
MVDVKPHNDPDRLFKLMHTIISAQEDWETTLAPRILLGLWHPKFIEPAQRLLPTLRRAHIGQNPHIARQYFWESCESFSIDFSSLSSAEGEKFRKECKASGKKLLVWTVNRREEMIEAARWGVDAILTDVTSVWLELRKQLQADFETTSKSNSRLFLWTRTTYYYPARMFACCQAMDEDESSEGESQRIAIFQKQAKRRYMNKHRAQQESLASLPGYTSQAEAEGTAPPKYPPPSALTKIPPADKYPTPLTAEEADEERDEVGDVVRRVRLRRKRSGSDSYLDSLLARSVHALELSNALLQSSMTTQSSLSALLSREDQLDSHVQLLSNQIHASDSRRVWVDDMSKQLDGGLSQSLPDAAGGFLAGPSSSGTPGHSGRLQHGDKPRSPPPRCMTVYADHTQDPDSILIPSTNGLRSTAQIHGLAPHTQSRSHSRQSSMSEDGTALGWGTPPGRTSSGKRRSISGGMYGIVTASSPQLSTPAPRRSSGRRNLSGANLPAEPSSGYASSVQSPNVQTGFPSNVQSPNVQIAHSPSIQTQAQTTSSNTFLSSPVLPVLSSAPAEPSTPAYNLLSAIVTRTPGTTDSESEGRRLGPPSESRRALPSRQSSRQGSTRQDGQDPTRLTVDSRVPRIESQISPGLDKRPRHLSENDIGATRGKGGWVAPMMLAGQKRGGVTTDSEHGSGQLGVQGEGLRRSHSARVRGDVTPRSGMSSRSGSKPPTPSRTTTNSSIPNAPSPNRAGSGSSSNLAAYESSSNLVGSNSGGPTTSPNRPVRHPFLAGGRRRSISTEDERGLQRYRSADALRKILDDAAAKRKLEEEQREREREEQARKQQIEDETEPERGRKPLARPTWSVIPRRGTTVAVETVAPAGTVSIEGITGVGGGSGGGSVRGKGGAKEGPKDLDPLVLPGEFWGGDVADEHNAISASGGDEPDLSRQNTIIAPRQDTLTSAGTKQDALTPTTARPDSPTRQRSQSMGPVTRLSSLLPKISVFGKSTTSGVGEPPPMDKGKGKAVDPDEVPGDTSKTPVAARSHAAQLSLQLNGALMEPDGDTTTSESETESQPSRASLTLPARLFIDSTDSITRRPSSLRLSGSPRPSLRQPGSGASTPRSVTFSPLPPKHIPSGGRPLSEAKTRRKQKDKEKEKEKPGWFASWFGPLPSSSSTVGGTKYSSSRRGWDSPRSMDDWQM